MLRPVGVEAIELFAVTQHKQASDPRQASLFDRIAA
jgi:hypothetical protein